MIYIYFQAPSNFIFLYDTWKVAVQLEHGTTDHLETTQQDCASNNNQKKKFPITLI